MNASCNYTNLPPQSQPAAFTTTSQHQSELNVHVRCRICVVCRYIFVWRCVDASDARRFPIWRSGRGFLVRRRWRLVAARSHTILQAFGSGLGSRLGFGLGLGFGFGLGLGLGLVFALGLGLALVLGLALELWLALGLGLGLGLSLGVELDTIIQRTEVQSIVQRQVQCHSL